jgi:DUF4097 and DUF4098 domain-containing protein YvlB
MSWAAPTRTDTVRISTTSGKIHVVAEPGRSELSTNAGTVTVGDGSVTIDERSSNISVRVPEGVDLVIGSTSGRVSVEGSVGAVAVLTTSGNITIERAASVDARSRSGRVNVGHVDGACRVQSTSGRIEVARCSTADATSRSGRIELSDAHGPVRANCTSGKVRLRLAGAHDVSAETVSGRIEVSLPEGVDPLVVSAASDVPDAVSGHDCVVVARSSSGRVVVSHR